LHTSPYFHIRLESDLSVDVAIGWRLGWTVPDQFGTGNWARATAL
jgi:hypothetical protein